MKRIFAWVLTLMLVLGLFAGCGKKNEQPQETTPATTVAPPAVEQEETITANDAMDYLKALYPQSEEAVKTAVDFERPGLLRVGGIPFTVVWSTDLPEEQIKIVPNEDGTMVVIDINEECEADTPYVLTATITDEQGNVATGTWDCILPQAIDMVAIVEEAYALKPGESLPYEVTLRGKITNIGAAYNPEYKNITVVIEVEGAEGKPIECYRLKGEGVENLQVGNIITVTGTIKNYQGKIEFDAGCILDAFEKGDAVDAPTDVGEILKAAYKLKDGKSLPYTVELTGTVIGIDQPYDPSYKNISVIIEMEGYSKYPILCYRLKGTEAENIAENDLITVTGLIKNYKGTIEFDAGCQLVKRVSGGGVAQKPSDDEDKILRDAKKLGADEKLPYVATLTGQVFSIDEKYSSQYDNITVTIKVSGTRIKCFHMKGDGVSKIKVGDTITVTGTIVNYKGETLEFSPASMTDRKAGSGKIKVELGPVEEGQIYYAEMKQGTLGKNLYFNGKISDSGYLKTSENSAEAVQINVEEVSGKGTRFYFDNNGTKTYIELVEKSVNGEAKQRAALVTEPTAYWNYDSELKVYFFDVSGVYCALGTYSNYDTISATKLGFLSTKNIGKSQFVVKYVTEPSAAPEQPETPDTPVGSSIQYVKNPVVGTAYKFIMNQASVGMELGFTGAMSGYYYATSDKIDDMVDVYIEEATGGYHIYFMAGNTKTYLNVIPRDNDATKTNVVLQTAAQNATPSVYEINAEFGYVKTACVGTEWYLGTYGTNKTISASKTSYISDTSTIGASQFIACFATIGEGGTTPEQPPVNPEQPETPAIQYVKNPVVGTAYKFIMNQASVGMELGFTGAMSGYYYATSDKIDDMVDVYIEEATGGYHIYFMAGNTKTYLNVIPRDNDATKTNVVLQTLAQNAAPSVYEINAEFGYVKTACVGTEWYLGTYGTNKTISASKTSYISDTSTIGVSQFIACFATIGEGGTTPEQPPVNPEQPETPAIQYVETPVAGTAYKFVMNQAGLGKQLGFTGAMSGYYYGTTETIADMVDVYLEETTGGYHIYFMAGNAKTYLNVIPRDTDPTKTNVVLETLEQNAAPSVYELNTEFGYVKTACVDTEWYLGTYGTNVSIGASKTSYISDTATIGVSQFVAWFATVGQGGTTPEQPPVNPEQPETPAIQYVENPVAGTAYKFVMNQAGLGKQLGFTGAMSGYYYGTSENVSDMVDVYLEEATGGYHIYFMAGNAKTYLNVIPRDTDPTKTNVVLETLEQNAAPSVYELNTEFGYVKTACVGTDWYLGTYNTNVSIGASKTSYISDTATIGVSQFVAWFATAGQGGTTPEQPPVNPEQPPVNPEQPAAGGSADFNTIVTSNPNGDGGYTNTYTTTNGWTTVNAAIQSGGATVMNPQYPVIGADNTYKAVCLNGKVSAPGKITSPNLTGGISKLTVNYTKMFTDTELSVTVTVTEVATGNTQTHVIAKSLDKNEKYVVYTDEWTLETPVAGEFTIEIVNNSPTAATGNKDRMTILSIDWEGTASGGSGSTTPEQPPVTPEQPSTSVELNTGDQVVIFAPAYNKALSSEVAAQYYQAGIDVTVTDSVVNGYGATSTWTVTKNADGSYSFANGGQNIALANDYSSMKLGEVNDDWTLESLGGTLFNIKNVVRGNYMEWYASKNNWSTYNSSSAATDDQFQLSIFVIGKGLLGGDATNPEQPPVTPEQPENPTGNTLTIQQALDMGAAQGKGEYTVEKYQITATVKSIEHTTYGNMYIQDANGTEILVYGTWDATGVKKYGEMTEKPTAGATVTLLSVVGNYNGTPQLKDAWIISFVPSATPAPEGPAIPAGGICLDVTVKENRTAYSTSQQVWQQNGIKLTNNKGASTSNVGDYCPIRLYKSSDVIIEYAGMTKLVFDCTNIDKKYAEDALLPTLQAVAGATVTMEGKIITVVLDATANSFSFTTTAQSRLTALYVYTN